MGTKLKLPIMQDQTFETPEHQAVVAVLLAAQIFEEKIGILLKPVGLSEPQYNILRILRSAGTTGLSCQQIGDRMITKDPDITRLLDRLEFRDLIRRNRSPEDRRVVRASIMDAGLSLLAQLDEPIRQLHLKQMSKLTKGQISQLTELLDLVRENP